MNHFSVRRSSLVLAALGATTLLAACQDKRVKQLDTGITRDSAMTVIAQDLKPGAPPDSFPNVYKRERYLIGGKTYEVLFFTSHDEKEGRDTVANKKLVPLVFVENKLVGKGWEYWDSLSTANHIPLEKHE